LPVEALPSCSVCLLVVPRTPVAVSEVAPVVPAIEAVGVPPATLVKAKAAEVVALAPKRRSCVVFLSKIAPLALSNGEPPLPTGRMPVTSVEARSTAEEESTPFEEICAMPCPIDEKVVVPPTVKVDKREVGLARTILPVVMPPSVKVFLLSDWMVELNAESERPLLLVNADKVAVGVPLATPVIPN